MTSVRDQITEARNVAAAYLERVGRLADAGVVKSGGGDDYVEVQIALQALRAAGRRAGQLKRALQCYADETFWDAEHPDASLAYHDRGEIARSALSGKELYAQHRD